jgi:rubrerythrin
MARLIDANELIENAQWFEEYIEGQEVAFKYIDLEDVENAATVDAVEVVHGRWIEKIDMVASYLAECEELFYECSVCNTPNFGESPYCPNCGAKMDGDPQ